MLYMSRNLGLITGTSVMGALFYYGSAKSAPTIDSPEAVAAGRRHNEVLDNKNPTAFAVGFSWLTALDSNS